MKKDHKISFQNIRVTLVLVSVAIFLFVYLYVCNNFNTKKDELVQENEQVQNQIVVANQLLQKQKDMDDRIKDMDQKIDEILEKYPANQTMADNIMFLKEMQQSNPKIKFLTVNLGDITTYYNTTVPAVYPEEESKDSAQQNGLGNSKWLRKSDEDESADGQADEGVPAPNISDDSADAAGASGDNMTSSSVTTEADSSSTENASTSGEDSVDSADSQEGVYDPSKRPDCMSGLKTTISIKFEGNYAAVKDYINYLENYEVKVTMDNMSLAYDNTTGLVNGSATISIYAILGSGKDYAKPNLSNVQIGTNEIFHTVKDRK